MVQRQQDETSAYEYTGERFHDTSAYGVDVHDVRGDTDAQDYRG